MMKQTWNQFEDVHTSKEDQIYTGGRFSFPPTLVNGPTLLKRKCMQMSNNDVDVTDTTINSSSYNEDDDDLEMKIQAVNCPTSLKQKFIFMSNNDLDSTVNTNTNSSSYSDDDGDVEVKFDTHSPSDHTQQNDGGPKRMDETCDKIYTKPVKDPERMDISSINHVSKMEYYDKDQHIKTMDTTCDFVFETEYFFVDQYSKMELVADDIVRDGWKREQFLKAEDRLFYGKSKDRARAFKLLATIGIECKEILICHTGIVSIPFAYNQKKYVDQPVHWCLDTLHRHRLGARTDHMVESFQRISIE